MRVRDILRNNSPCMSFEFFPPKVEKGWDTLFHSITSLRSLDPAYISVTCGAMGSTREPTLQLVRRILQETDLTVVVHQTCRGLSRDDVRHSLDQYASLGVQNILALRGDPPRGQGSPVPLDDQFIHAVDLVREIKKRLPHMGVGVAGFPEGHPDTPNRLLETDYLKAKVDAGVDYIVTQLFFDNRDFYDFRDRCELAGITVPIIPGIMPITSRLGMYRTAAIAQGARLPAPLIRAVERARTRKYVRNIGVHWATEQVRDLLEHDVGGVHFYTLNHSDASMRVCQMLGVETTLQFQEDMGPLSIPEPVLA